MSKERKFQVGDEVVYIFEIDYRSPYRGTVLSVNDNWVVVKYHSWKGFIDDLPFVDSEPIESQHLRKVTPLEKLL